MPHGGWPFAVLNDCHSNKNLSGTVPICMAAVRTEQRRNEQASLGEHLFDVIAMNPISFELLCLDRTMQRGKMASDFKAVKTQTHLNQDRVPFPRVSQEPSSYSYPGSLLNLVSSLRAEA